MMSSLHIIVLLVVLCLNTIVASADEIKYHGENITIKCPAPPEDALGVTLYTRREIRRQVTYYYYDTKKLTVHKDFDKRVKAENDKILKIDIINLQQSDTGAYWCQYNYMGKPPTDEKGVFLLLQPPINLASSISPSSKPGAMNDLMIPVVALTGGSVLLLLLLVLGVWLVPKIRKQNRNKEEMVEEDRKCNNGVYEVMTVPRRKDFL